VSSGDPQDWLVVVLALLLFVAALLWWRALGRVGRANRHRNQVARRGEADAERLLLRAGYRVIDRQVTGRWTFLVDGEEVEVRCRADLIVEARGRRFVAEVKTGGRAPDPTHPATRRQLLEYTLAFDVDGVLLVDMAGARIHTVAFGG
jgi:hypothetical protein